ncbi:5364_t:CDS:2, partial [Cetraspora pellucida]
MVKKVRFWYFKICNLDGVSEKGSTVISKGKSIFEGGQHTFEGKIHKIYSTFVKNLNDLKSFDWQLKEIKHDNIIEFYGITHDLENNIKMLVLQHSTDGSLKEYLIQVSQKIEPADKLNIAKDIVNGLKYLHDEGITSRRFDPRLLKNTKELPDKESDIYSLGFILWRVFSNDEPFSNYEKNLINLVNEIYQNKREKPTVGTPKKYINVYEKCWSSNLNERPSIKQ